jgi:hypothetical protein
MLELNQLHLKSDTLLVKVLDLPAQLKTKSGIDIPNSGAKHVVAGTILKTGVLDFDNLHPVLKKTLEETKTLEGITILFQKGYAERFDYPIEIEDNNNTTILQELCIFPVGVVLAVITPLED